MQDRLYNLQSYYYETGKNSNGQQFIIGLLCPNLVCIEFDQDGNFQELHIEEWLYPAPQFPNNGPYKIPDEIFVEVFEIQKEALKNKTGFIESKIQIREFECNHAHWAQFPSGLDALEYSDYSPEEFAQKRKDWVESGLHVFSWAEEHWINPDGSLNSS